MSWPQGGFAPQGVFAPPQQPVGPVQHQPANLPATGYEPSQIPPPPGVGSSPGYGVQPGVPGTQIQQPLYPGIPQAPQAQPTWGQQPQGWPQQQPQQPVWPHQQQQAMPSQPAYPVPQQRAPAPMFAQPMIQTPAPQAPAPQQPPRQEQPQAQRPAGSFWQNPEQRTAEIVAQVVDQRIMPALAPVMQQSAITAAQNAETIARQTIPDYDYLAGDIRATLAQAPAAQLGNPELWTAAADLIRGQRLRAGSYDPRQAQGRAQAPQQQRQTQAPQQPQQQYAPQMQPQQPVPAPWQFFTEGPSVPANGGFGPSQQPTQADYLNANQWGMQINDWMNWKYGQGGGR